MTLLPDNYDDFKINKGVYSEICSYCETESSCDPCQDCQNKFRDIEGDEINDNGK